MRRQTGHFPWGIETSAPTRNTSSPVPVGRQDTSRGELKRERLLQPDVDGGVGRQDTSRGELKQNYRGFLHRRRARRQTGHFPWGIETPQTPVDRPGARGVGRQDTSRGELKLEDKLPALLPGYSRQTGHFPWGIETRETHGMSGRR